MRNWCSPYHWHKPSKETIQELLKTFAEFLEQQQQPAEGE
jgi:hypothetical protein